MNIACFLIGALFGMAISLTFTIEEVRQAYRKGYKEGKNETVSSDK